MKNLFSLSILLIFVLFTNSLFAQNQKKKYSKKNKRTSHHVLEQRTRRPVYRANLPNNHLVIRHRNSSYHYNKGNYYVFSNNQYHLTYPNRGLRIQTLPIGYRTIVVGRTSRYYYNGIFYNKVGNEYEVIDPPLGSIVPEIPIDNSTVILIDGKNYYQYNLVLFEPIATTGGTQYRVIEKYQE